MAAENANPGTRAWEVRDGSAVVQGYSSQVSTLPGQAVTFHVSSSEPYRITVYRLGWYQRLGARTVSKLPPSHAHAFATPARDADGEVDAGWPVTDVWHVPGDAVSGYYLAVARVAGGLGYQIPVIVRSNRRSAILVQASVNTWQAYNNWGGQSLYDFNSSGGRQAWKVSFDRPYAYTDLSNPSPLMFEYQAVRFFERSGLDVTYTTDVDTDADPSSLLRHKLVIVLGHQEYWSQRERQAFDAARNSGVNLAFFGADTDEWQARYEDDRRTLVEYRNASLDPLHLTDKSARFEPECSLTGLNYDGFAPAGVRPYTVNAATLGDPWFAGTGFTPGANVDVVGYEWDGPWTQCSVQDVQPFFLYDDSQSSAAIIRYRASSGSTVFSVGTVLFSWALDGWRAPNSSRVAGYSVPVDSRLQRFTLNALTSLSQ